jgi:hypothetical protein
MRTIVLAYVIALMGFIMIGGGGVGPFLIGSINDSALEILRSGNRNDLWRPWLGLRLLVLIIAHG